MRVNINLENFRKRNKEGIAIKEDNCGENIELTRRKLIREEKEKKENLKKQNSLISKIKRTFTGIKSKLTDKVRFKENLKKASYGYYVLFVATIILGTIGTALNISTYKEFGKEKYSTYSLNKEVKPETIAPQKYKEEASSIAYKTEPDKPVISTSNNVVLSEKKEETKATKIVSYVFKYISPIKGSKVSKVFSLDKVIYSETLEMWKIHEGIDLAANIKTKVISIEKGKIERIYSDSLYGTSVILNHENGYKSIYRNLDKDVSVKEGQSVIKGQNIGMVGNTAICEIKDPSHLHLEVIKNSEIVNPESIITF